MRTEQKKTFSVPDCTVERFSIEDIITSSQGDITKPTDIWDTDEF